MGCECELIDGTGGLVNWESLIVVAVVVGFSLLGRGCPADCAEGPIFDMSGGFDGVC